MSEAAERSSADDENTDLSAPPPVLRLDIGGGTVELRVHTVGVQSPPFEIIPDGSSFRMNGTQYVRAQEGSVQHLAAREVISLSAVASLVFNAPKGSFSTTTELLLPNIGRKAFNNGCSGQMQYFALVEYPVGHVQLQPVVTLEQLTLVLLHPPSKSKFAGKAGGGLSASGVSLLESLFTSGSLKLSLGGAAGGAADDGGLAGLEAGEAWDCIEAYVDSLTGDTRGTMLAKMRDFLASGAGGFSGGYSTASLPERKRRLAAVWDAIRSACAPGQTQELESLSDSLGQVNSSYADAADPSAHLVSDDVIEGCVGLLVYHSQVAAAVLRHPTMASKLRESRAEALAPLLAAARRQVRRALAPPSRAPPLSLGSASPLATVTLQRLLSTLPWPSASPPSRRLDAPRSPPPTPPPHAQPTLILKLLFNLSDRSIQSLIPVILAPIVDALDLRGERLLSTPEEVREAMREAKKELGVHEPVYGEGGAVCVCVDGRKAFERLMGTDDEPSQYRRLCTPSLAKCQQYPNGVSTWATTFDGVKVARRTHTSPLVARNAACRLLTNSTRPLLVLALPNVNDKKTSELKWLYSPTVSFLEWLGSTPTFDVHTKQELPNEVLLAVDGAAIPVALNAMGWTSNFNSGGYTDQDAEAIRNVYDFGAINRTLAVARELEELHEVKGSSLDARKRLATSTFCGALGAPLFAAAGIEPAMVFNGSLHYLLSTCNTIWTATTLALVEAGGKQAGEKLASIMRKHGFKYAEFFQTEAGVCVATDASDAARKLWCGPTVLWQPGEWGADWAHLTDFLFCVSRLWEVRRDSAESPPRVR